ncbi:zinc-binding dehydrogenase [Micromonospora sp. NPDC005553]|uniref:zinc-binding dehydrogenase n=1 Tax=Micromonospora sp. NPDC005553 TaxID=3364232 RepID=UPI0036BCB56C
MKAVVIREFGDPRGLAVVDLPVPVPAPGQALITIEAAGVAGADVLIRSGALAAYGFREGHIPGGEVAGTITAVGDGVDPAWIGQRVWAFTGTGGGYAEQAVAPIAEVLSLPAGLPAVDAVTLGSSGAGGSDDPAGYDVIIDVVAGPDMPAFFDRLNPNGRLVALGAVGGQPPAGFGTRLMAAFQKSMSFATFSAATVTAADRQAVRTEQFAAAAGGELQTVVHEVLPLERAAVAHQKMDAGEVFGRIVLTTSSFH